MSSDLVLVLVHDADPSRGAAIVGTLRPALEAAGCDVVLGTLVDGSPVPDPHTLRALVVMGSAAAAYDNDVPWLATELGYLSRAVDIGTPVLGVCFGGQALARVLGGTVMKAAHGEHGFTPIDATELVEPGPWMEFHGDTFTVPPGAQELARTDRAVQAFRSGPHLGLQFHPEIDPACFAAWRASWALTGADVAIARAGIDADAIAANIQLRAEEAAARCARLVHTFLTLTDQQA